MKRELPYHSIGHVREEQNLFQLDHSINTVPYRCLKLKQSLIEGLDSVKTETGWTDPGEEKQESLWTDVEVCVSLLETNKSIDTLDALLEKVEKQAFVSGGKRGWSSENIPDRVSTYVTADVGLLYLTLGFRERLSSVLNTLYKIQNVDGGWGVCEGDKLSKTGATAFVVFRLFSRCYQSPWAFRLLEVASYRRAVHWLNRAYIDSENGWGNIVNGPPANLSATGLALNALLSTERASISRQDKELPLIRSITKSSLMYLIGSSNDGSWRGPSQVFGIKLEGEEKIRRHVSGGAGSLFVIQCIAKAMHLDYLSPDNPFLALGITDLEARCRQYKSSGGYWIVPSDEGGPPTSWNSAFAIDALNEIDCLFLDFASRNIIEISIKENAIRSTEIWKRVSFASIAALTAMLLGPNISGLAGIVDWFESQDTWTQGVVMIIVGIALQYGIVEAVNGLRKIGRRLAYEFRQRI